METSLHRQLKTVYAGGGAAVEVPLAGYRIDAVIDGELIEIQHGSLAAIRDKIARLLERHRVRVVKPIVASKLLIRCECRGGAEIGRRLSPRRGVVHDLFHELIYFTRVFPHRRLTLEAVLVDVEERRYPGHGRRRRRRERDHQVEDQRLVGVRESHRFRTAKDLLRLLPADLPAPFHTGQLAEQMGVPRFFAQRIAYCLRQMGAVRAAGKQGNAHLYAIGGRRRSA